MDMDPRFQKALTDRSDPGTGYDAPTRYGSLNYRTKLQKFSIVQFLRSLVVKVHEEFEEFRLLLDDVQFSSRIHERNACLVKLESLFGWDGEDPTVHEDVGPGPVRHPPFFH
jgi:hypothetical protein